jgi:hypothetical protein
MLHVDLESCLVRLALVKISFHNTKTYAAKQAEFASSSHNLTLLGQTRYTNERKMIVITKLDA